MMALNRGKSTMYDKSFMAFLVWTYGRGGVGGGFPFSIFKHVFKLHVGEDFAGTEEEIIRAGVLHYATKLLHPRVGMLNA